MSRGRESCCVLREVGVVGARPATPEGARAFDLRRKLPRYHWRSLAGIRVGEALADLQRVALAHAIRLPTSFSLVGKTLS